jgi:quinol-cytochrome oxidoreductase complex cytochrome b subunit
MLKFKTNKIFIKELVVTHFGALHKQTKNLKKKEKIKKN